MPIPTPRFTQEQRDKDQRTRYLLDLINTPVEALVGATLTRQEVYVIKVRARDELSVLLRKEWEL